MPATNATVNNCLSTRSLFLRLSLIKNTAALIQHLLAKNMYPILKNVSQRVLKI